MNIYVLNVTAGKEEYSADLLRSLTALSSYHFWIPQKPVYFRKDGATELIHTVLYPAYIFVDAADYYPLLAALREHSLYSYLNLLGKRMDDLKRVSAEEPLQNDAQR